MLRSKDRSEHWDWALTDAGAAIQTLRIREEFGALLLGENFPDRKGANGLFISTGNGVNRKRLGGTNLPARRRIKDFEEAGKYLFASSDAGNFRLLGYRMKLYDNSLQEWSRREELPMESTD